MRDIHRYEVLATERKKCYTGFMAMLDPIMQRFRADLERIYGDNLERVVLFGSRARGDARPDSDYDVAIFLKEFHDRWQEMDKILPIVTKILYSDLVDIQALPYGSASYHDTRPLMDEIRRDGIDL